jgi:hypothetical protein
MRTFNPALAMVVAMAAACAPPPPVQPAPDAPEVLRLDDSGMNHSLNISSHMKANQLDRS